MNIYVGNLAYNASQDEVRQAFEGFGAVTSVNFITDRNTGDFRGFAFVEMAEQSEGEAAIAGLNGQEMNGRTLTVNEAKPRESRSGGGGGRGRYRH